jgi:hypothetical protein
VLTGGVGREKPFSETELEEPKIRRGGRVGVSGVAGFESLKGAWREKARGLGLFAAFSPLPFLLAGIQIFASVHFTLFCSCTFYNHSLALDATSKSVTFINLFFPHLHHFRKASK